MEAKVFFQCEDQIGEGILWLDAQDKLLWLDIDRCILHVYDFQNGAVTEHYFPDKITTIIPLEKNKEEVIIALKDRIIYYHLQNKISRKLMDMPFVPNGFRTNDGKASPEGRLWIDIMHMDTHHGNGSLYCIDHDLSSREVLSGQSIPNGIVWNREGDRMYYADSGKGCIYGFTYDRQSGNILSKDVAVQVPSGYGIPDGMAIDENDHLWVAHWGGFGVYVWNPVSGLLIDKVEVPVPNVASCTFGKDNQLFITTARSGLSDEELKRYPLSGSVFVAETPVRSGTNHYPFKLMVNDKLSS